MRQNPLVSNLKSRLFVKKVSQLYYQTLSINGIYREKQALFFLVIFFSFLASIYRQAIPNALERPYILQCTSVESGAT
jgi:hypothetical protein